VERGWAARAAAQQQDEEQRGGGQLNPHDPVLAKVREHAEEAARADGRELQPQGLGRNRFPRLRAAVRVGKEQRVGRDLEEA
jgi:hypothetical protein